jgi:hypothetical protein
LLGPFLARWGVIFPQQQRGLRAQQLPRSAVQTEGSELGLDIQKSRRSKLTKDARPALLILVFADAKHAQAIVSIAINLVGMKSAQNVDQVSGTKALLGPRDRTQRFPTQLCAIERTGRMQTVVAAPTLPRMIFPEVGKQTLATTRDTLTQCQKRTSLRCDSRFHSSVASLCSIIRR